jgi:hypothetical protein
MLPNTFGLVILNPVFSLWHFLFVGPGRGTFYGVFVGELVLSLLLSHNGLSRTEGD